MGTWKVPSPKWTWKSFSVQLPGNCSFLGSFLPGIVEFHTLGTQISIQPETQRTLYKFLELFVQLPPMWYYPVTSILLSLLEFQFLPPTQWHWWTLFWFYSLRHRHSCSDFLVCFPSLRDHGPALPVVYLKLAVLHILSFLTVVYSRKISPRAVTFFVDRSRSPSLCSFALCFELFLPLTLLIWFSAVIILLFNSAMEFWNQKIILNSKKLFLCYSWISCILFIFVLKLFSCLSFFFVFSISLSLVASWSFSWVVWITLSTLLVFKNLTYIHSRGIQLLEVPGVLVANSWIEGRKMVSSYGLLMCQLKICKTFVLSK